MHIGDRFLLNVLLRALEHLGRMLLDLLIHILADTKLAGKAAYSSKNNMLRL